MKRKLLIVFVKNFKLGKVKTRLAKTVGNQAAFEIYKQLVAITEKVTETIEFAKVIYFSDEIIQTKWMDSAKKIQFGIDLGARMKNAFSDGFNEGFESIVLIGSDLPDLSSDIINKGFEALQNHDIVFGPAEDGGYYLIGMNQLFPSVFQNKPWSQANLLIASLKELEENTIRYSLLETLNDIDTYDDLIASDFYKNNSELQQKILKLND